MHLFASMIFLLFVYFLFFTHNMGDCAADASAQCLDRVRHSNKHKRGTFLKNAVFKRSFRKTTSLSIGLWNQNQLLALKKDANVVEDQFNVHQNTYQ